MFTIKRSSPEVKIETPMLMVPNEVYLALSVDGGELQGATVRAESALGDKIGSGYINSVRWRGGDRHVSVRLIIGGLLYFGSVNWDTTRFCKIELSNQNEIEVGYETYRA